MITFLKRHLPPAATNLLRIAYNWKDPFACARFLAGRDSAMSFAERQQLVRQLFAISLAVDAPHTQQQMLEMIETIVSMPPTVPGVVVEAGCYKGGSTAKLSLAAQRAGRDLVVFDSFEGIPDNTEHHAETLLGERIEFNSGDYRGTLHEVRSNVTRFGRIAPCRFVAGWLEDTLPTFREPVAVAYLDVDLATSTRTALKYLYPLLSPGGVLFSHDGHLSLVVEVFADEKFWLNDVGCPPPVVAGLGERQLIKIVKS